MCWRIPTVLTDQNVQSEGDPPTEGHRFELHVSCLKLCFKEVGRRLIIVNVSRNGL